MDIAIYLRKSRAEEYSDSLDDTLSRHSKILKEYAEKMNYAVVDTFEEVVSGESLYARPQMMKLLEHVEAGEYDAVLCMDIDRLGRGGMRDQGIILDAFKYSSTLIITPDKIYNLNDEMDEELTEFKSFMSRREYKIITKRLRRGLKQTINDGGYIANAPYGYEKVIIDKKPSLKIVESEAAFVKMMYEMYLSGNGCDTIARRVNELGAKPRRTNSFGRTTIRTILKNPTYCGKIAWNKKSHIKKGVRGNSKEIITYNKPETWTIVDGLHEAIISESDFEKVQKILQSRHIPSKKIGGVLKNPLAGLIVCSNCGHKLQLQLTKDEKYIRCVSHYCCSGTKLELVESAVINYLHACLKKINLQLTAKAENNLSSDLFETALADCRKELELTKIQLDKLRDLLEQGVYDIPTYKQRSEILTKKITALENQEQQLINDIGLNRKQDLIELKEKLSDVLRLYYSSDATSKNQLLKSVIQEISYSKDTRQSELSLIIRLKNVLI